MVKAFLNLENILFFITFKEFSLILLRNVFFDVLLFIYIYLTLYYVNFLKFNLFLNLVHTSLVIFSSADILAERCSCYSRICRLLSSLVIKLY